MGEAIVGVKQLAFNNEMMTALTQAIATSGIEQGIGHWSGPPERVKEGFQATIRWPLERKTFTTEELQKITVPTIIFYCWQDVAYPVENAQSLNAELRSAGVRSELFEVNGPHYGIVDSASVINPRIRDLVLSCYAPEDLHSVPISAEYCTPKFMRTPFQDLLAKYDYVPEDSDMDFDI